MNKSHLIDFLSNDGEHKTGIFLDDFFYIIENPFANPIINARKVLDLNGQIRFIKLPTVRTQWEEVFILSDDNIQILRKAK